METIINKAIEGGYKDITIMDDWQVCQDYLVQLVVIDPLFWQSLGKACGWGSNVWEHGIDEEGYPVKTRSCANWEDYAIRFHEKNLTQCWTKAVEWLEELIKE